MNRFLPMSAMTAALVLLLTRVLAAALPALDYDQVFLLEAVSDPQPDPARERIVFVRH